MPEFRRMTRHCHNCGCEYTLAGNPGRLETCPQCGADLKVCLNCIHHDRTVAEQCRERRADLVHEKHVANYCEYFDMAKRVWQGKGVDQREQAARERLKKLFGD
jgi:hypothetical protein